MDIALALVAGIFIGAVLGFIGAGGAMVSVPIWFACERQPVAWP